MSARRFESQAAADRRTAISANIAEAAVYFYAGQENAGAQASGFEALVRHVAETTQHVDLETLTVAILGAVWLLVPANERAQGEFVTGLREVLAERNGR